MNRDMFYGNYQAGGFSEPNFMGPAPNMNMNMNMPMNMQPQGYNVSGSYQAFGPNVIPGNNMSNMNNANNQYNDYSNDYESRITKLERQVRRIDQRLRKLENSSITTLEEDLNDFTNVHMI